MSARYSPAHGAGLAGRRDTVEKVPVHPIAVIIIELCVVAFFFAGWVLWSRRKRQARESTRD